MGFRGTSPWGNKLVNDKELSSRWISSMVCFIVSRYCVVNIASQNKSYMLCHPHRKFADGAANVLLAAWTSDEVYHVFCSTRAKTFNRVHFPCGKSEILGFSFSRRCCIYILCISYMGDILLTDEKK